MQMKKDERLLYTRTRLSSFPISVTQKRRNADPKSSFIIPARNFKRANFIDGADEMSMPPRGPSGITFGFIQS